MAKLTPAQQALLTSAQNMKPIVYGDGSTREPSILVSGNTYRTAIALERKGLGTVRYQGHSLGWFAPALNPTAEELADAKQAEEDVPLVVNGQLTPAGRIYVMDVRAQAAEEA